MDAAGSVHLVFPDEVTRYPQYTSGCVNKDGIPEFPSAPAACLETLEQPLEDVLESRYGAAIDATHDGRRLVVGDPHAGWRTVTNEDYDPEKCTSNEICGLPIPSDDCHRWCTPEFRIHGPGAVYVYQRSPVTNELELEATLTAELPQDLDRFGTAVAIAEDIIAVGSHRSDEAGQLQDTGTLHIFQWTQSEGWKSMQTLSSPDNDTAKDFFALGAIATDGLRIAVGASNANKVYVYERTLDPRRWYSSYWSLTFPIHANLGASGAIDIDGGILAAGIRVDANDNGSVTLVERIVNETPDLWPNPLISIFWNPTQFMNESIFFGSAVATFEQRVAVYDENCQATIYETNPDIWGKWDTIATLEPTCETQFGAIDYNGNHLAIASHSGPRRVHVFDESLANPIAILGEQLPPAETSPSSRFGKQVILSDDRVVTAAEMRNKVYLFDYNQCP